MNEAGKVIILKSKLEKMSGDYSWHIVRVSRKITVKLGIKGNTRRVVCTLNGSEPFQCGLMPDGKGAFFISLNKKLRDKLRVSDGEVINVALSKDESKYGLPMPVELAEVMHQDPDGDRLFHSLKPGNQRLVIRMVDAVTDINKRIHRALVTMEYLKKTNGKFVYDELQTAMRRPLA
jgi:uncharacterized protein DUF1905